MTSHECSVCKECFPSKTKLFKHLESHGVEGTSVKPVKIVLLIGWIAPTSIDNDKWINDQSTLRTYTDSTGEWVENSLFSAVTAVERGLTSVEGVIAERPRGLSRGSSCSQRSTYLLTNEPTCHGACDTISFHIRKSLLGDEKEWMKKVNNLLPETIRILEIYVLSGAQATDFHAEVSCNQRRYEYLLPIRYIVPTTKLEVPVEPIVRKRHARPPKEERNLMDQEFPIGTEEGQARVHFFRILKRVIKKFAGSHPFHNYVVAGAAAGDSGTVHTVDRFYHKELRSYNGESWVLLSVCGDGMVRGQIRKMVGLVLGIIHGWLPEDYIEQSLAKDLMLDVPAAPGYGLYLTECRYAYWEANPQYGGVRFDPRRLEGHDTTALMAWITKVHEQIVQTTIAAGDAFLTQLKVDCDKAYTKFLAFQPFHARTQEQLNEAYQRSFGSKSAAEDKLTEEVSHLSLTPPADAAAAAQMISIPCSVAEDRLSIPCSVAEDRQIHGDVLYKKVLQLLQEAHRSGHWPGSTVGRQNLITTPEGGTFGVGVLPKPMAEPKGNALFPELMFACFKLEMVLCPHRKPSGTIAINRHAQFLPHRDSGAGNGQSSSLIVALGDFVGGEVVIDNVAHDIRYKPVEFDGWSQLHWTLPFVGQRYSLVWFTPLGVSDEDLWWWRDDRMKLL